MLRAITFCCSWLFMGVLLAGLSACGGGGGGTSPTIAPPLASFDYTATGLSVAFDGSGSSDSGGQITGYTWTFGDGGSATTVKPTHVYSKAGTYTVTLVVANKNGASNSKQQTVAVSAHLSGGPLTANFVDTPSGLSVLFDGSSSSAGGGTIVNFAWNFGDGGTGSGAGTQINHVFSNAGTYSVTLKVTDSNNNTSSVLKNITVSVAPLVRLSVGITNQMTVHFDGSGSSEAGGAIASYAWNFGDSTTDNSVSPQHTYATGGQFTVTLTVTDTHNVSASTQQTVTVAAVPVLSSQVWTWLGGSELANTYPYPSTSIVYGTQGVAAAGNHPGPRSNAITWTDAAGKFWLFGGSGYGSDASKNINSGYWGPVGELNDLWTFDPVSGLWTWVSGSGHSNTAGSYGTQGVGSTANLPGGREGGAGWVDAAGKLWLFGGTGYGANAAQSGELNDLWTFDPSSGQWTWVNGASTVNNQGSYGSLGVAAAGNLPPGRHDMVSWKDGAGKMYFYGGLSGTIWVAQNNSQLYGDLWQFDPGTGQWTWINGSNQINAPEVYGTLAVAAPTNQPGGRAGSVAWLDGSGKLWLFGGANVNLANLFANNRGNDLWVYDPGSGEWTWVGGPTTASGRGVYGTQGTAAAGNLPGARQQASSWVDANGNFWLMGGFGYDGKVADPVNDLSDVWKYNPVSGQWTWVSGVNSFNASSVFSVPGIAYSTNLPGARYAASAWTDASGKLWLFGGYGYSASRATDDMNELWSYAP